MLHVPFTSDRLRLDLDLEDPVAIVDELAQAVVRAPGLPDIDAEAIAEQARTRDEEGSSVRVAPDVVVLHVRLADVDGARFALARLKREIPWVDGGPARFVGLLVAPRERPVQSLRLFEQLERLLADPAARNWIEQATDADDLAPWLDVRVQEDDGPLHARDVMRPSIGRVGPDTPVPELARRMARHGLDAVGITDAQRRLIGLVTANDLFTLGLPDFMRQLESVSFLAELDPFERYFAKEQQLRARDVMRSDFAALPPDATILEVVFQLAVKDQPKVFVVEDGRLLGVIDRIRVLDRILEL